MNAQTRLCYAQDVRISPLSRGWIRMRLDWRSDHNLPRATVVDVKPGELVSNLLNGGHISREEIHAIASLASEDAVPVHVAMYPMLPMAMHNRIVGVMEKKIADRDQEIARLREELTIVSEKENKP